MGQARLDLVMKGGLALERSTCGRDRTMTEESGAILVVDDDADMREMVHDMLKDRRASGHHGQ